MPRGSIFHESKDKFCQRKNKANLRETLREDPLLAANRTNSIVYEFELEEKIWAVFATREWENFAVEFNRHLEQYGHITKGINIEAAKKEGDGRTRFIITLPSIEWVEKNRCKRKFPFFETKSVNNALHVPQYLDFCIFKMSPFNIKQKSNNNDRKLVSMFGTGKLISFDKTKNKFTVIVYGAKTPKL